MSGRKWVLAVSIGALLLFSLAQAQDANRGQPGQPPGPGAGPGGVPNRGPGGGPPNWNWEEMRERMMNDLKNQLGSADDEWKVLRPKIEKVQTAQFATIAGMGPMGGFGGRRPGGPGGPPQAGPGGGPGGMPESKIAQAQRELWTVLEKKDAPPEDIKKKLTAYREARDKARAELQAAQKELKELVTARQEALLVMRGMLE